MIAVIDYGLGNLRSVSKALESLGAEVQVTSKPEAIAKADAAVLPGVGAFYVGMENINKLGLASCIKDFAAAKKPFLGICLGLQLLFSESEEHGTHKGLDIIKGKVVKFKKGVKIPHMGWNSLKITGQGRQWTKDVPDNSYFYFVHSYFVKPEDKKIVASTTNYGQEFCSAIALDNIYAVQFHPEKSSKLGLKILENFLTLC